MSYELKEIHDDTHSSEVTITLSLRLVADIERIDMLKRKHPAKLYYNETNGQLFIVPAKEERKGNYIIPFLNVEELAKDSADLFQIVKKHDARVRAKTEFASDHRCIVKDSEGQA